MPDMDGLALQAALAGRGSDLAIIFLSGHGDIATGVKAMKRGAAEKTIKTHRARVMSKMQTGSLAELVRLAGQVGIDGASAPDR